MEVDRRKKRWRYSQERIETKDLKKCVEKKGIWKTKRRNKNNTENKKHTTINNNTPFTEYIKTRRRKRHSKESFKNMNMCLSGLGVVVEENEKKPETNVHQNKLSSWIRQRARKDINNSTSPLTIEGVPVSIPKKKTSSEYFPSTYVHESRLLRVRKNMNLYTPDTRFEEALMAPWTRRGIVDSMGDNNETI